MGQIDVESNVSNHQMLEDHQCLTKIIKNNKIKSETYQGINELEMDPLSRN